MLPAVRSLHLLFAACWIGAYVAGDYLIRTRAKAEDPLGRARAAQAILLGVEMPMAAIVPLLGLALAFMNHSVLMQRWFHMKLSAFIIVFAMLMIQAKRLRLALDSDTPDAALGAYMVLRLAGGIMFLVIIAAVTFRFGAM
ncbi:hypothetical protein HN371_26650 [Candidatus Poribacteria bacterium]|jgi:uncharacterized membrane protein|nr:hypothetical protein [Candidatus Poribacteria bacterium]MBT5534105.1 hypothetical protein [Candidatus Poribacteria bacterium]MBT5711308.1 hypothetical protein [Candidatus Poribacteria bacterium]MBT7099658.1 hypothetical protein [Candidatus Poribacteria bacterium]MBT7809611.1 hypothetical protein [Candidatus Poribacteria bacterium]